MVVAVALVVERLNMRFGGPQLLTPLHGALLTLAIGLLVVVRFLKDVLCPAPGASVDEEGKFSREKLRAYLYDQDCADISDVQEQIPPVYQDLQDYAKNHRLKKTNGEDGDFRVEVTSPDPPPLPVLDPQILRQLENASENEHGVLCGTPNSEYVDGELELFGNHEPRGFMARWFSKPDIGDEKVRRRAVRRKRKVARKLKTCLYIRAWIRSIIPPESLRVELDDDGEMYIDKATNCLVDNKLREFFKLHCFNLQSIAEYQDLAKVVVFYTNEELGIAELLEPRLGRPLPR
jgi:hypothetical protein